MFRLFFHRKKKAPVPGNAPGIQPEYRQPVRIYNVGVDTYFGTDREDVWRKAQGQ